MNELLAGHGRPDDESLMTAIAARESSALAALYDRHAATVLALCLRILRDRTEAEEVLGDVFFEVWNRHERYRAERGAPIAYLLTLARSRAVDRLRSRRQRERVVVAADPVDLSKVQPEASPASPLDGALADEQRRRVVAALAGLSESQRRALEMSFYDGLSHSEIAACTGEPLGTVKTRIRQGLIHLRQSLRAQYEAGA